MRESALAIILFLAGAVALKSWQGMHGQPGAEPCALVRIYDHKTGLLLMKAGCYSNTERINGKAKGAPQWMYDDIDQNKRKFDVSVVYY